MLYLRLQSNAIIIGFNVKNLIQMAKATAERKCRPDFIRVILIQAIEDIEGAMKGMLEPIYEEKVVDMRRSDRSLRPGVGNITSSYVLDGL